MELYNGKAVLYGCGDFVDDYAVDDHYRNDLSALYFVVGECVCCVGCMACMVLLVFIRVVCSGVGLVQDFDRRSRTVKQIEVMPTQIATMQVCLALGSSWLFVLCVFACVVVVCFLISLACLGDGASERRGSLVAD